MYENEVKNPQTKNGSHKNNPTKTRLKYFLIEPEVKSWRALMTAFQSIFSQLEKGMAGDGFTISRFQVLLMLYFDGPLSAVDISRRLLVTRGNMSMFLKRLLADKLVCISRDSKSTSRPLYCLTGIGLKKFEILFPKHIKRVRKLMPVLPNSMIQVLKDISMT